MTKLAGSLAVGFLVVEGIAGALPAAHAQGCCCRGMMGKGMSPGMSWPAQPFVGTSSQAQPLVSQLQGLLQQTSAMSEESLKNSLTDNKPEMRWAAALVAGERKIYLQDDLVKRLTDPDGYVRQAARRSLILLSAARRQETAASQQAQISQRNKTTARGVDFGPAPTASSSAQARAARQWQAWWDKNK
jgi:hypothetical protein